jgi:predicted nucleic-acid-binding protein
MPPFVADANIMVRLITFDVPELARKARSLLQPMADESVELPLYVLAEVVYILTGHSSYKYSRDRVRNELLTIIDFPQFSVSRDTAHEALQLFSSTKLDFVDCLLLAKHRLYHQTVLTFDKSLLRHLKT